MPIEKAAYYRALERKKNVSAAVRVFGVAALLGGLIGTGAALLPTASLEAAKSAFRSMTYYPDCSYARAAGAAPIKRGEPGYRSGLDADDDGIACEPYPRR